MLYELELYKHLDDNDSEFDDFKSVASENIQDYK
jgi:hypothetical protein